MPLISDVFYKKKLGKHNINIKTKYIVGNKILERNTDGSINDDIKNGIICQKLYYINNILSHVEKNFDSRIEYTFIFDNESQEEYTCPNCGKVSTLNNFIDGCPYCKTYYNMDYIDKDLGSKYHYDLVLKNSLYRILTAIIDVIISLILAYLFIKSTSRTFNNFDIYKIFIYGAIFALILYYFFYLIDAYIILLPIKKYKERQNRKQLAFWSRTKIDKKSFFNNLNYEIRKKYYNNDNVIDYDVLDYLEFKEFYKDNKIFVKVKINIRLVYIVKNKIVTKINKDYYLLEYNSDGKIEIGNGVNIIKCHNCGASVDITKGFCEYCKTKINI